ncbi:MAG: SRPBCC family protein [Myxococcota bacterium]|nr:SRPBCC family protein [Myxococcota bacterium]
MSEGFDVDVVATVRAPIDQVWALFRPFGAEVTSWWPIYEWVKLEAPGKDEVGAVRAFHTKTGRTYRERLVSRDDATHTEVYELLSIEPSVPTLGTILTTVVMTAHGADTIVRWSSQVQAGGLFKGRITSVQSDVYAAAIKSLDAHFHPSLGKLRVKVVAAKDLPKTGFLPPDPYVIAQLDGGAPARTRARLATTHPQFAEDLELDVRALEGRLELAVWDACLGRDSLLGSASLDIHDLTAKTPRAMSLPLSGEGKGSLDITLELALGEGDHLAFSESANRVHSAEHLLDVVEKVGASALAIAQEIAKGHQAEYGYARYGRSPQIPDVPLEDLPRMVAGLPADELLSPTKLGRMAQRGAEYAYAQGQFVARFEGARDPFEAYYGGDVPRPWVADHATDDRELARQLVQGVNPHVIRRVRSIDEVPGDMRALTSNGRSLGELIEHRRLFLCDYPDLATLRPYRDMVFYAPSMLVVKDESAAAPGLDVLGIRLTRESTGNRILTRATTPPNLWRLAKLHVACADNQYHQWLEHLGYAHLAMEPFAIATHDAFQAPHAIGELLRPHFHDTIGINFLARQTLVSDVAPFTDRTFSTGTAQALQMFLGAWKRFDFGKFAFPDRMSERGFDEARTDGLEGYLYRDDGFAIWNAIDRYVGEVVDATYADDRAVASDPAICAWARECSAPDRGAVPGFPAAIETKDVLRRALSTIIYQVSAGHSAVNYAQYDYLGYVPNRPDSLFRPFPDGTNDVDDAYLRAALPNEIVAHFQISFAYLLTLPAEQPLTSVDAMKTRHPEIHARFQAHLAEIGAVIAARDAALVAAGRAPYPYLHPDRVAASIAI